MGRLVIGVFLFGLLLLTGCSVTTTDQALPTPAGVSAPQEAPSGWQPPMEAKAPELEPEPAEIDHEWAEPQAVPILMYHVIDAGPNTLYVPADEFEGHLRYLSEAGYTTITLEQLADHYEFGAALPERPIVLTFDDGYVSVYTNALPLLKEYNMLGTFFIITDLVGQAGYVTWAQLAEMAEAGMEIGSHTISHPDLSQTYDEWLLSELAGSKQLLEQQLDRQIEFFAYPAGRFNEETVAAVQEHYRGAVTTVGGFATVCQEPALWQRVRINNGLGPEELQQLLAYWETQTVDCE